MNRLIRIGIAMLSLAVGDSICYADGATHAYTVRVSVNEVRIARNVRIEFEGKTWHADFGSVGADADFYSDKLPALPKRLKVEWTDQKGVANSELCNVPESKIGSYDGLKLIVTISPTGCDVTIKELR